MSLTKMNTNRWENSWTGGRKGSLTTFVGNTIINSMGFWVELNKKEFVPYVTSSFLGLRKLPLVSTLVGPKIPVHKVAKCTDDLDLFYRDLFSSVVSNIIFVFPLKKEVFNSSTIVHVLLSTLVHLKKRDYTLV